MLPHKKPQYLSLVNEYSEYGENINTVGEFVSINNTNKLLDRAATSSNINEVKSLISKIKNARMKSYFEKSSFSSNFDEYVSAWGQEAPNKNGEKYCMLDSFINELKVNSEFVKAFKFTDEGILKLWVIVKDSISDEADEIYSDFLKQYYDKECSIMIYDNEVVEHVERQIINITNIYEVISKDECATS